MADEVLSQAEIEALIAGGGAAEPAQEPAAEATAEAASSPGVEEISQPAPAHAEVAIGPAPTIEVHGGPPPANVRPMEFAPIGGATGGSASKNGVDLILDVQLQVSVELGRSAMSVREVLAMGPGSVVELEKHAGEPVEVVVNNKIIARGEVVVIDENFGVRITEIVSSNERNSRAKAA